VYAIFFGRNILMLKKI